LELGVRKEDVRSFDVCTTRFLCWISIVGQLGKGTANANRINAFINLLGKRKGVLSTKIGYLRGEGDVTSKEESRVHRYTVTVQYIRV